MSSGGISRACRAPALPPAARAITCPGQEAHGQHDTESGRKVAAPVSEVALASPSRLRLLGGMIVAASLVATAAMVVWWGAAHIGAVVWRALPALPAAIAVHCIQLTISGYGWWLLLERPRPKVARLLLARWVREALNTVLPIAGLSGGVAATRLLARNAGLTMAAATAATTGDLTCEAISQAPYLIMTLAIVALLAPGQLSPGRAALAIVPIALGAAGFVLAQRMGLMRLVERAASRLGFGQAMAGLHDGLMQLHARPVQVTQSVLVHMVGWGLGGAEVWVILRAIGHPVGPAAAFAIEGLGMAARSIGFALPSGLAAQEAGFVVACAAFGIAAPDALAMSMLKRLRELIVGVAGVIAWRVALLLPAPAR
jgi:putative membrane protein